MRKATYRKSEKLNKLITRLFTNTTEYFKYIAIIVVLIFAAIQIIAVIYGMATKSTISVGFTNGWLPAVEIKRPGSQETNPTLLTSTSTQPMVRKQLYEEEINRRKKAEEAFRNSVATSVKISYLPQQLQGKPEEVVSKIVDLYRERQAQENSVWYCCYKIAIEIAQTVSIDTKLNNKDDDHMKEVYRCVQVCLNIIGYYEDEIDGDQARTKAALARFQQDHGLSRDCKLGKKTWCAILKILAEEIHGHNPSGEEHGRTYAVLTAEDINQQTARILSGYLALAKLAGLD